jgi:hypothetical protein
MNHRHRHSLAVVVVADCVIVVWRRRMSPPLLFHPTLQLTWRVLMIQTKMTTMIIMILTITTISNGGEGGEEGEVE